MQESPERIRVGLSPESNLKPGYKAQTLAGDRSTHAAPLRVTVDNFRRAESDRYFAETVQEGGFGKFHHRRELMPVDQQTVVRPNRDTLYSTAVFDLDAAPVTIWLPDSFGRFMSLMALNEDHYVSCVAYDRGEYAFTRARVGTRYMMAAVRTLVTPGNREDLRQVHALQDSIGVSQSHFGRFVIPNWDPESQGRVRDALLDLGATLPDMTRMFGSQDQVDPVRHLIGTAMAWGGNPERDATYVSVIPERNDGTTVHQLTVHGVPVDGFWSISVYNPRGYFEPNDRNTYSLNNITAQKDADGSITVQLGGCDGSAPNCLPIVAGWNYLVRLYRPRSEILDGSWTFPVAQPLV